MTEFEPPLFSPNILMRGGHLQTLASLRKPSERIDPSSHHIVPLADGDSIVVHENLAVDGGQGASGERVVVLFHGLSGCHQSPYMVRLAYRWIRMGWTVYRVDMRGCGAAKQLASGLSHAGRSEDIAAALGFVANRRPDAAIAAVAISLGGNQLLRFAGRIGQGLDSTPDWFGRLKRIAVVAPPIDLVRCSENMGRLSRRMYNYYFIRALFDEVSPGVRQHPVFQGLLKNGRPRTLYELDDQLTAPLSGFAGADDYYQTCSSTHVVANNPIPTMVLAAKDDPIVPADCFEHTSWPDLTRVVVSHTGGHAGFVGRRGQRWMDDCLVAWMNRF